MIQQQNISKDFWGDIYMCRHKKIIILVCALLAILNIVACEQVKEDSANQRESSIQAFEDINLENIHQVNISGNAKSIVIGQSANENFEFHNEDLNTAHTYDVHCDENGDVLDINIMMENAEEDNNILGSFHIDVPQKEFEKIEVTGDFGQISLYTINSDVLIYANNPFVYLDLEAEHLEHNITLNGSGANTYRGVSVYLDKFPDNVKMELNLIQGGTINDPQNILQENGLESGTGKPVISINHTKELNVYRKE